MSYFDSGRSSKNPLYPTSSTAPSSSNNFNPYNPAQSTGTPSLNQQPSHARSSLSQVTNATSFSHSGMSLGPTTSNLQLVPGSSSLGNIKPIKFGTTASTAKWSSGSPTLGSTNMFNQSSSSFATSASPSLAKPISSGPLSALLDKRHEQQLNVTSFKDTTSQQPYIAHPARERKYYEATFRQTKPKVPAETVLEKEQSKTSSEDAPPRSTLYEFTLSPDMKHAHTDKSTLKYHKMDLEDTKNGTPTTIRDTEITVFGFPSSASAAVLEMFRQIGTVEHYEVGAGNWLHINYASTWSANKALSKNGKIFPTGAFMIGVVPGKEARNQLSTAGENFLTPIKGGSSLGASITPLKVSFATKVDENVFAPDTPIDTTTIFRKPLKRTYEEAVSPGEDNSLLTKLVKYVFGW